MIIDAIHLYTKEYSTSVKIAELSLNKADLSQTYILEGAVGLEAPDFSPQYFNSSSTGVRYYYTRPDPREVKIKIILNPQGAGVSYSSLRDTLYKTISSSYLSNVELRFMSSTTEKARLTGLVTKFESEIFSSRPYVIMTMLFPDPLFKDPTLVSVTGLNLSTPVITDADSTAPHGFTMQLTLAATVAKVLIQKANGAEWYFTISGFTFASGDIINFSSVTNNKYLYVMRGATRYDVVDKLAPGSTWPIIFPGSNTFSIVMENPIGTALTPATTWSITSFSYAKTYWGI